MSYPNGGRVPCKYFQQGRCTRGSSCKFAHVYSSGTNASSQGNQNMSEADIYRSFVSSNSLSKIERTIANDLKDAESFQQKPLTSAYSYGAPCAVNLISGRDYAPEESRYDYYNAQRQGNVQQYATQINTRENDMQKCFSHVKSHTDWAARFLQKNTKDLAETGQRSMNNEFVNFPLDLSGGGGALGAGTFNSRPSTSGSALGQPAFGGGNTSSGSFGAPAFGSPRFGGAQAGSGSTSGAFGRPEFGSGNSFGSSNSGTAFGAPSNPFISNKKSPGNNVFSVSALGSNPSPASDGSTFGKPAFGPAIAPSGSGGSPFGKPAFGTSTIPLSSDPALGKPAFGSTSANAFGSPAFGKTAFGSGSASADNTLPGGNSAFGQPSFGSDPTKANGLAAFGKPAFGSTPRQTGGSTSAFGQPNFTSSPFGTANQNQSTPQFGSSPNTQHRPPSFGTAIPTFGSAPASSSSPFASIQSQSQSSPFGQSAFASKSQPISSPFGSSVPAGTAQFSTGFGSQPSPFPNVGNSLQPQPTQAKFVQGKPTQEDKVTASELDQKSLEQFQNDHFILGNVPDIPPPLELIA